MVPEYLGDNLAQGINVVARSPDKTPSIYPKKVGEIGESRKGVAVVFPICLLCLHSLTNGLMVSRIAH